MKSSVGSDDEKEFYRRVDPDYKHKVYELYSGNTLRFCYQCGACTANCPLSQLTDVYRPNKILEMAKLGIRNIAQGNAFLLCSACTQCTKGCPQGVRVHEFMYALKELAVNDENARESILSGFEDALAELSVEMPFPISYCWICLNPVGDDVNKDGFDANKDVFDKLVRDVLYRSLSRFEKKEKIAISKGAPRIAVIGSGPAGLTAAWELCKAGFAVTVFEPLPEAGGMFTMGIPTYRLPNEIVASEVEKIKALGVEVRTNTPVDKTLFREFLNSGEYKAVFIATGAHMAKKLRIEGEDQNGVVLALDFLRGFNLNEIKNIGKKVVVIGGGNVGIDAARTALRCEAETVSLFCLESRDDMPSHAWEIQEAIAEGVLINPSWGPKKILGDGEKVTGIEFVRCKSVFDTSRRFNPVFDDNETQTVEADVIIPAIGQSPALDFLRQMVDIDRGAVSVDPLTMKTSLPGVFAGGDTVLGTASLIEAIIAGRTAAGSIIRYLEDMGS